MGFSFSFLLLTSERCMTPAEPAVCAVRSAVPAPECVLPKVMPWRVVADRSMILAEPEFTPVRVWSEVPAPTAALPAVMPWGVEEGCESVRELGVWCAHRSIVGRARLVGAGTLLLSHSPVS